MSESENVNKALEKLIDGNEENIKNTGEIGGYIESIEGDNESLKWRLKEERNKNRTLSEAVYFSGKERHSQQKRLRHRCCLWFSTTAYALLSSRTLF